MPGPRNGTSRPSWQFSLRWLVLSVLILGPLLGFAAPKALEIFRQLKAPPPPPVQIPAGAFEAAPPDYYESAETPLD